MFICWEVTNHIYVIIVYDDELPILKQEIGPDQAIVSETGERERQSLDSLQLITRPDPTTEEHRQPGSGCAIVYNSKGRHTKKWLNWGHCPNLRDLGTL